MVERALAKQPAARFASMVEMWRALLETPEGAAARRNDLRRGGNCGPRCPEYICFCCWGTWERVRSTNGTMKLELLTLKGFTVFDGATTVDFAPGVNVFIGENGTGKSHVLKLVYALTEATRRHASGQGLEGGMEAALDSLVRSMLLGVFRPDGLDSFVATTNGEATISPERNRRAWTSRSPRATG